MQGVPSALVARNESWVRQQAQSLVRHLPANVEKADLIQAGLIAVAQASLSFEWEGDRDTPEAREAFVRYARSRVKGAMLDELRQMDVLSRSQRRKIKVVQIARERWRAENGAEATLAQVSRVVGMAVDEVAMLDGLAEAGRTQHTADEGESGFSEQHTPATERDEVEARVDTAIVLRRLEAVFARLPERERQVIDAYLGVGLTPVELAASLKVTPSRVAQIYAGVLRRLSVMFGHSERATDRLPADKRAELERLVAEREAGPASTWGRQVEEVLASPAERFGVHIDVPEGTRW